MESSHNASEHAHATWCKQPATKLPGAAFDLPAAKSSISTNILPGGKPTFALRNHVLACSWISSSISLPWHNPTNSTRSCLQLTNCPLTASAKNFRIGECCVYRWLYYFLVPGKSWAVHLPLAVERSMANSFIAVHIPQLAILPYAYRCESMQTWWQRQRQSIVHGFFRIHHIFPVIRCQMSLGVKKPCASILQNFITESCI